MPIVDKLEFLLEEIAEHPYISFAVAAIGTLLLTGIVFIPVLFFPVVLWATRRTAKLVAKEMNK